MLLKRYITMAFMLLIPAAAGWAQDSHNIDPSMNDYIPPPMFGAPSPKAVPPAEVENTAADKSGFRKLTREEMLERNNMIVGSERSKIQKSSKTPSLSGLPTQNSSVFISNELGAGNVIEQTAEDILRQIDKNYKGAEIAPAAGDVTPIENSEKKQNKADFPANGQFEIALPYAPETSTLSPEHRKILNEQILLRLQKFTQSRLEIRSYATSPDAAQSHVRRVSLERALRIRDFLVGKGIAAERIDVRALGPAPDPAVENQVELAIYQN